MRRILFSCMILSVTHLVIAQESPHGKIKIGCGECHTPDSWKMRDDAKFDHSSTGFDLTGAHQKTECVACHQKLNFSDAKKSCGSCHTDIHMGELGTGCLRCHTTEAWKITDMIQRHQQTRFPLFGKHAAVPCESCHEKSSTHQYAGTPTSCIGCHQSDFLDSQNPNHLQAGFSTDCIQCHRVDALVWNAGFDHQLTAFPLTGAHRVVPCSKCHVNLAFKSTPRDCYSCHNSDFQKTVNPNHIAGNFSHSCEQCHTTSVWSPSTFNHANTSFPLIGAHQAVPCASCHVNNVYAGLHRNCIDCHRTDYNSTSNPSHIAGNFSTDCTMCHSMVAWSPATFDHNTTKFPLTGHHTTLQCQACHTNGNYQLAYTGCYTCHQNDFNGTTDPNHVAGNFSHQCDICHSTVSWSDAKFDHTATKFPLTGAHITVQCQNCHVNGNYQLAYTNCYQCHNTDFTGATTPVPHTGFSTNCLSCHTQSAWSPSTFTHANVTPSFPNDNRHSGAACAKCHQNPANYTIICCQSSGCHNTCAGGDN